MEASETGNMGMGTSEELRVTERMLGGEKDRQTDTIYNSRHVRQDLQEYKEVK